MIPIRSGGDRLRASAASPHAMKMDHSAPIVRNHPDMPGWQTTPAREWTRRPRRGKLARSACVLKLLNSIGFWVGFGVGAAAAALL